MSTPCLHVYRLDGCGVGAPMSALPQPLVGFGYSPARFVFLRGANDALETGRSDDRLDQLYDVRLFNASIELRWLRDPCAVDALGTAVIVSEQALDLPGWRALPDVPYESMIDRKLQCTMLDGEPDPRTDWWRFDAQRHGKVAVPVSGLPVRSRLLLQRREYVGCAAGDAGADGNREVVEERLLGWIVESEER